MLGQILQWFQDSPSLSTFHQHNTPQRSQHVSWAAVDLPSNPLSMPRFDAGHSFFHSHENVIEPDGVDPRIMYPIFRELRDTVPDVSAGVWAWVRLCSTPQNYTLMHGDPVHHDDAHFILRELDRRILTYQHEREKGIDALVHSFFMSIFTYGAFAGEVVVNHENRHIENFIIIDPATIRFQIDPGSRELMPCQILDAGTVVKLNPSSFFYYGLDADGLYPYGKSPLASLQLVVKIQEQMIQDMASAQHNAGYPTIHFKLRTPERHRGETLNHFHERLYKEIQQIQTEVEQKQTDSNLITYDNIDVNYVGPGGQSYQWSESIQVISEQVISALHLAPFMIGRNWGTTESWGTAQYQLVTNNARSVQEGAKRLAEWLRNLELILHNNPCCAAHHFMPHHHLDSANRAKAFQTGSEAVINLVEHGLIDEQRAKEKIDVLLHHV